MQNVSSYALLITPLLELITIEKYIVIAQNSFADNLYHKLVKQPTIKSSVEGLLILNRASYLQKISLQTKCQNNK